MEHEAACPEPGSPEGGGAVAPEEPGRQPCALSPSQREVSVPVYGGNGSPRPDTCDTRSLSLGTEEPHTRQGHRRMFFSSFFLFSHPQGLEPAWRASPFRANAVLPASPWGPSSKQASITTGLFQSPRRLPGARGVRGAASAPQCFASRPTVLCVSLPKGFFRRHRGPVNRSPCSGGSALGQPRLRTW